MYYVKAFMKENENFGNLLYGSWVALINREALPHVPYPDAVQQEVQ